MKLIARGKRRQVRDRAGALLIRWAPAAAPCGSRDANATLQSGGACGAHYWTKAPIVKYGEAALVRSR